MIKYKKYVAKKEQLTGVYSIRLWKTHTIFHVNEVLYGGCENFGN